MKRILVALTIIAFTLINVSPGLTQYAKIDHDVRQVSIGFTGANDNTAVNGTLIVPRYKRQLDRVGRSACQPINGW